ncbi:hypothetical protein ABRQ07_06010 [Pectobacterium polonicum]|uniref:Uncharacterized protein n=1 Tax=Pectobacterium polonicum TaxID=2485124 RepID=A0ABV1P7N5_9GAMM
MKKENSFLDNVIFILFFSLNALSIMNYEIWYNDRLMAIIMAFILYINIIFAFFFIFEFLENIANKIKGRGD